MSTKNYKTCKNKKSRDSREKKLYVIMAEKKPKKISPNEAEKLQDFAQGLDDEITNVVDYGDLGVKEKGDKEEDA